MPNLVGIGNSQVPTNAMLGGLAYQDSVGEIDIEKIKARTSDNAVDIFVYDTRKDSDGGAWRKKATTQSWYNEGVSQYRGARKEFPAVAVIVVTDNSDSTSASTVIYDGDDPNLPMWMKWERDTTQDPFFDYSTPGSHHLGNYEPSSVSALNGIICVGTYRSAGALSNLNAGLREFHFIEDACYASNDDKRVKFPTSIADRDVVTIGYRQTGTQTISNANVRGIAMTVMPNAPIGESTGLPIPTIAVATDGGLSVLRDDGTIVDWIESSGPDSTHKLSFRKNKKLGVFTSGTAGIAGYPQLYYIEIPSSDVSANYYYNYTALGIEKYGYNLETNSAARLIMNTAAAGALSGVVDTDDNTYASTNDGGLGVILPPESVGTTANMTTAAISYVTKDYNTGYMFGDIKGAFMSDTDATNITGSELVTNGNFSANSNWTYQGGTTSFNISSGKLNYDGSGTIYLKAYQNITGLTVGQTYVLSINLTAISSHNISFAFATSNIGNTLLANTVSTTGTHSITYTATQANISVYVQTNNATMTFSVDDVSLRIAEEDRSVRNKGLQVFGSITKNPVATGAELVAYSGFNESNYLFQPHNTDLEFGTGDYSVMLWYKGTSDSTGNREIFANLRGSTNHWVLAKEYTNKFVFDTVTDPKTYAEGVWNHVAGVRESGTCKLYVNGELVGSATANDNINDTSDGLIIGQNPDNSDWKTRGSLALLRISASTPSAEQVKKIYDHEKCLYHENSKCTLYGTSDDVNALAVDDSNNVVYVGTSSGRSDFRGLNRINNTTTAVTTAISASNELVAEQ